MFQIYVTETGLSVPDRIHVQLSSHLGMRDVPHIRGLCVFVSVCADQDK